MNQWIRHIKEVAGDQCTTITPATRLVRLMKLARGDIGVELGAGDTCLATVSSIATGSSVFLTEVDNNFAALSAKFKVIA